MRELCSSVPVWIPDAEFENCYDEFCHQVCRARLVLSTHDNSPSVLGSLALLALCRSGCPKDETLLRERVVQAIHVRQQALRRCHHRKLPRG